MRKHSIAFDSKSQRRMDENGFMHVSLSHISKETVNPYYGREIPDWQNMGLDPERVYQGYRAGEELAQAAATFNGLPLLQGHHVEHAEAPQKEFRVGSLGTNAVYAAPYLDNSLVITDAEAIRAIEQGTSMELSAAYMYDADFTAGSFEGQPYDFVMRNIRGNHVAIVPEGRAGADVVVADAQINPKPQGIVMGIQQTLARIKQRVIMALDADPSIEKTEVDLAKALLEVNSTEAEKEGLNQKDIGLDADKDAKIKTILEMCAGLDPEKAKALGDALQELAYDSDTASDEDPKAAEDADDPALDEEAAVKKAMDACGLDAEDPDAQKAFAEGVKYGEGNAKAEPQKPAADESEGAKAAMDSRMRRNMALDAASIQRGATQAAKLHFKAVTTAARNVRPLVGDIIDPMAFDSADDIYGKALDIAGFKKIDYPRSAWRGMCDLLRQQRAGTASPATMAHDSKADGMGKNLSNIRVEG
ncbi:MAG: DUF2213 domain-containing protein [Desulfovibrionaceae bacterium]